VRSVAGLIRRRGSVALWEHAIPASGPFVDEDARVPRLTAGGVRTATGPTGERYGPPHAVRAYFSKRTTSVLSQTWGMVDERDAQLDVAVPFAPEPENGILLPAHADAWNRGAFAQFPPNVLPGAGDDLTLIARDRFTIAGIRYIVKAAAVPIQDNNITIAWRLLIGAATF